MAVWPNGTKNKPYTSDVFGWRAAHPITGLRTFHYGWDNYGYTYNCAPEAGVVIFAQYNGTAGNHIQIRTPSGVVYGTMHNARILVSVGQQVAEGEPLGVQGTTGGSTGVHNHQEVLLSAQYVDPEPFIALRLIATASANGTPLTESDNPMFWLRRNLTGEVFLFGNAQGRQHVADPGQLKGLRTLTQTINVPGIPVPSDDPKQIPGVNEDLWGLAIDFFGQPTR